MLCLQLQWQYSMQHTSTCGRDCGLVVITLAPEMQCLWPSTTLVDECADVGGRQPHWAALEACMTLMRPDPAT